MEIFAHRGDSGNYPENTILAFKKALEIGVDGIELDVHKSKDNQLVVIHDEDIKRTIKGKGLVKDYTLKELKNFNCRDSKYYNNNDCKICTLREVMELIKNENITLNIEAKTDEIHYDLESDVLDLIYEYGLKDKILISSFYHQTIKNFEKLDDRIKYGALYWDKKGFDTDKKIVEHAKNMGVYSINISTKLVTKDIVKMAHDNKLKVLVYTVNTRSLMQKMIDYNVDGVFTDYPKLMKDILIQ